MTLTILVQRIFSYIPSMRSEAPGNFPGASAFSRGHIRLQREQRKVNIRYIGSSYFYPCPPVGMTLPSLFLQGAQAGSPRTPRYIVVKIALAHCWNRTFRRVCAKLRCKKRFCNAALSTVRPIPGFQTHTGAWVCGADGINRCEGADGQHCFGSGRLPDNVGPLCTRTYAVCPLGMRGLFYSPSAPGRRDIKTGAL